MPVPLPRIAVALAKLLRSGKMTPSRFTGSDDRLAGIASIDADRRLGLRILRLTTSLAVGFALLATILLPIGHFYLGYLYHSAHLEGELDIQARLLAEVIAQHPGFWEFEAEKLQRSITTRRSDAGTVVYGISDAHGMPVVQVPAFIDMHVAPTISRRRVVHDEAQKTLAEVAATMTLRPLLRAAALTALLAGVLSFGLCYLMRMLPLRALRSALDRVGFLATHDPLTGLPNRTVFHERLHAVHASRKSERASQTVLCLDLDRFKAVNDTLGHVIGDRLLQIAAKRLSAILRKHDCLARVGGDEFAVHLWPPVRHANEAATVARRMIQALSEPFVIDAHKTVLGASVGIAFAPAGDDAERLLAEADLALGWARTMAAERGAFSRER